MKPEEPRVQAVLAWLRQNYTLDENPGMGGQGIYYYYHTMTKALSLAGVNTIDLPNGKSALWAEDLGLKLMNLQKSDGHWQNEAARWWEKESPLVTSYALISLQILQKRI